MGVSEAYNFCTYFDTNYLARGLSLYRSLEENCGNFQLWILCMDENVYRILSEMALPKAALISILDLEAGDAELAEAKKNRSRIEYYFTCTPSLALYILNNFKEVDFLTYLDADLYFFDSPSAIFEEIYGCSVAIIEHRYSDKNKEKAVHGVYNVGWLSFRRDENGMACLNWWRQKCNEWCYDRVENSRFADQKYLDEWPARFKNVFVIKNKGANLAPWNISNYSVSIRQGKVFIDEQPLVFFHFHGLKRFFSRCYIMGLGIYRVKITETMRRYIYKPYLTAIAGRDFNCGPGRGRNKIVKFAYTIIYFIIYRDYIFCSSSGKQ